jgi:capsule polysaccharide export protein KpsE/RkpR
MEKQLLERTQSFKWNSKFELYSYFDEKYGINRDVIDGAIASTIRVFRPRKHQVIKTQELWQKVGNLLENDYMSLMAINNVN